MTFLGNAYSLSNQHREANNYYYQAIEFNPNFAPAALGLANSFEKLDEKENAIAAYKNFLKIWKMADENIQGIDFAKNKLKVLN